MKNTSSIKINKSPERTESYLGQLTDTTRWNSFEHRKDDVFIWTPPKCGTIWMQAICANLVFGTDGFEGRFADISP